MPPFTIFLEQRCRMVQGDQQLHALITFVALIKTIFGTVPMAVKLYHCLLFAKYYYIFFERQT